MADAQATARIDVEVEDHGLDARLAAIEARYDAMVARLGRKEAIIRVKGNISDFSKSVAEARGELDGLTKAQDGFTKAQKQTEAQAAKLRKEIEKQESAVAKTEAAQAKARESFTKAEKAGKEAELSALKAREEALVKQRADQKLDLILLKERQKALTEILTSQQLETQEAGKAKKAWQDANGADLKGMEDRLRMAQALVKQAERTQQEAENSIKTTELQTRKEQEKAAVKAKAAADATKAANDAHRAAQTAYDDERKLANQQAEAQRIEDHRAVTRARDLAREASLKQRYVSLLERERELDKAITKAPTAREKQIIGLDKTKVIAEAEVLRQELKLMFRDPIEVKAEIKTSGLKKFENFLFFWDKKGKKEAGSLKNVFTGLKEMNVNLGPFNASLKGVFLTMTLGAPVLASVLGSLGSLVSVLGTGVVGAAGLGGAALAGFGLALTGIKSDLHPIMAQLTTVDQAMNAYQRSVMKYGPPTITTKTTTSGASSAANAQARIAPDQAKVAYAQQAYNHVLSQYGAKSMEAAAASIRLADAQNTLASAQRAASGATSKSTQVANQSEKAMQRYKEALKQLPPELRGAVMQWFNLRNEWQKLTQENSLKNFGNIVKNAMQTGNANVKWFAHDTNVAFNDIRSAWDRWMKALRTPEAKTILHTIFANFDRTIQPVMDGFGRLGAALGRWFATMSKYLPGIAKDFAAWAGHVNDVSKSTDGWNKGASTLILTLKELGKFAEATGKFLFALFAPGIQPGNDLLSHMTDSLDKAAKSMRTMTGQNDLKNFFSQSVDGARTLWQAVAPLGRIFIALAEGFAPIARAALPVIIMFERFTADVLTSLGPFGYLLRDLAGFLVAMRLIGKVRGWASPMLSGIKQLRSGVAGALKQIDRLAKTGKAFLTGGFGAAKKTWSGLAPAEQLSQEEQFGKILKDAHVKGLDEGGTIVAEKIKGALDSGGNMIARDEEVATKQGGEQLALDIEGATAKAGEQLAFSIESAGKVASGELAAGVEAGALAASGTTAATGAVTGGGTAAVEGGTIGATTARGGASALAKLAAPAAIALFLANAFTGHGGGGGVPGAVGQGVSSLSLGMVTPKQAASPFRFLENLVGGGPTDAQVRGQKLMAEIQKKIAKADWGTLKNLQDRLHSVEEEKGVTKKQAAAAQKVLNARGGQIAAPKIAHTETAILGSVKRGTIGGAATASTEIFQGLTADIAGLPEKAQIAGAETMIKFTSALEKKGKLAKGTTGQLIADIYAQFGPRMATKLAELGGTSMKGIATAIRNSDVLHQTQKISKHMQDVWVNMPVQPILTMKNFGTVIGNEMDYLRQKIANSSGKTKKLAEADYAELKTKSIQHFTAMTQGVLQKQEALTGGISSNSAAAGKAASQNLKQLMDNVKKAMDSGDLSTKTGMQFIADALNATLKAYGVAPIPVSQVHLPPKGAANSTLGFNYVTGSGMGAVAATGARIPGQDGPDNWTLIDPSGRPAGLVGGGELLVTNRHTEARVDNMLSLFGTSLGQEVAGETRPHSTFAKGGRLRKFSTGGYPGYVTDSNSHGIPGGDMIQGQEPQILKDLYALSRELRAPINVNSGYRTPAISVSVGGFPDDPHTRGEAADISIAGVDMTQLQPLNSQLAAVGLYRPFYPSMGVSEDNHVQLLNGGPSGPIIQGKGGMGMAIPTLDAPTIKGKSGISKAGNAALKKATAAANKKIRDKLGSLGGMVGMGGIAPGSWQKVASEIAKRHGWGPSEVAAWEGVERLEDGSFSLTAKNPSSNAYGLAQFINGPSEYATYGGNSTTLVGQLTAMANYIAGRYGTPSAALAFENANHYYAKGGRVKGYSRGGRLGRLGRFAKGGRVIFKGGMSVETDGVGPGHGDTYHQGHTSYADGRLNADKTHFTALFDGYRQAHGISFGDVERVRKGNRRAYAIVGDSAGGGSGIHGEGSYSLANALGIPSNPNTGGTGSGVEYTIFPGTHSRLGGSLDQNKIDRVGKAISGGKIAATGSKSGSSHPTGVPSPRNPGGFQNVGQIKWFTALEKAKEAFYAYKYRINQEYNHPHIEGKPGHWNSSGTHWIPSTLHKVGEIPKSDWLELRKLQTAYQTILKQHPKWKTKHGFSSVFDIPAKDRIGGIGFSDIDTFLAALKDEYSTYRSALNNKTNSKGQHVKPTKAEESQLAKIKKELTFIQRLDHKAKADVQDFTLIQDAIDALGVSMDTAASTPGDHARGISYGMSGSVPGKGKMKDLSWGQWHRMREYWEKVNIRKLKAAYRDIRKIYGPHPTRWQKGQLNILSGALGQARGALRTDRAQADPRLSESIDQYIGSLHSLPGQITRDELVRPGRFTHQKKNDRDDPFGLGGVFGGPKYHTVLNKHLKPSEELSRLQYFYSVDKGKIKEDNPGTPGREDILSSIPAMRDAKAIWRFYQSLYNHAKGDPKTRSNFPLLTQLSDAETAARQDFMGYKDAEKAAATATGPTQFQLFDTAREQMFAQYGSNISLVGGPNSLAGAGAAGAAAAASTFSPSNPAAMPSASGHSHAPHVGSTVTVNNYYKTQPNDPHTWSAALAWELQGSV
jgi:hypothetical protein